MAGTKRTWEGTSVVDTTTGATSASTDKNNQAAGQDSMEESSSSTLAIFGTFRDELDEHHDRRERIVKTSRDITALSKKIIFALQRIRTTKAPIPPSIAKDITPRFEQITTLVTSLIPDLTAEINPWRYQRQISPGIQELIEALAFKHYLETQALITLDEVRGWFPEALRRVVSEEDYLMGLFDFTGEVMRFAVTSLGISPSTSSSSGQEQEQEQDQGKQEKMLPASQADIVVDLRVMRASLEMLTIPRRHSYAMMRDFGKKLDVMQSSVEKVERAAYGILVRGSERPAGWMPDLQVEASTC